MWVDYWPLAVSNWGPGKKIKNKFSKFVFSILGQPDSGKFVDQHRCVKMGNDGGKFYNDNCDKHLPFICKAEFVDYTPSYKDTWEKLGHPVNCSNGYQDLGNHCYKAFS